MVPEIGHFSLILALGIAITLAVLPMVGVVQNRRVLMNLAPTLSGGMFVFVAISFGCLIAAFLMDDFSVNYIARNSNSRLPDIYKVSAVWGAHEGSFLLWILVMSAWTLAVAMFSGSLTLDMRARVLSVQGLLNVGFILFILLTSNPFERSLPVFPADGNDLNPLLQDFGLIVHPPMLYMGYVGFSVPFAFAIATLLSGRLDSAWAKWSRPWANAAWAFLAIGITLGSWWAYYELGWGGWWFWDAVENASFMPWLVGTALIHSLAATEKRGVFKSWTVLLAIFAFSLSLLGAFLVRSGVLTSVHAFAVDPERGLFILLFLVLVIGGSLTLFAVRVANIKSQAGFDYTSRESLVLVNNLLLTVMTGAVLLGTLYPLAYEAITDGKKISVGPPYFNTVFIPLALVLFSFMAFSQFSRWKKTPVEIYHRTQVPLLVGSLLFAGTFMFFYSETWNTWAFVAVAIGTWVFAAMGLHTYQQIANKSNPLAALLNRTASWYGMWLGHVGIAVTLVGVALVAVYSDERDVRMVAGDEVVMEGYTFTLKGVKRVRGPNYQADRGEIVISRDGERLLTLYPEKRFYDVASNVMTEAAIDPGLFRDLYVAMGDSLGNGAWAVRVHYKPYVRWVWLGGILVACAGFLTVFDRRYRRVRSKAAQEIPLVMEPG